MLTTGHHQATQAALVNPPTEPTIHRKESEKTEKISSFSFSGVFQLANHDEIYVYICYFRKKERKKDPENFDDCANAHEESLNGIVLVKTWKITL